MLKFLFEVEYKDGTSFKQNEEDVSFVDPKRSAFFDVKMDDVKRFILRGENVFCVDLTDGHFEVNDVSFKLHEEELNDFRLIFWRQHTHTLNTKYVEKAHEIVYKIGWQTNGKDGKNIQRIMEIN